MTSLKVLSLDICGLQKLKMAKRRLTISSIICLELKFSGEIFKLNCKGDISVVSK